MFPSCDIAFVSQTKALYKTLYSKSIGYVSVIGKVSVISYYEQQRLY